MQERTTLDEVKQAFNQWRTRKLYPRERVPNDLRAKVRAIEPYYTRRQIIDALAINKEQIDKYVHYNQSTKSDESFVGASLMEFIEVPITELAKTQSKIVLGLTITRGDGSIWALTEATQDIISDSLRLFLRG